VIKQYFFNLNRKYQKLKNSINLEEKTSLEKDFMEFLWKKSCMKSSIDKLPFLKNFPKRKKINPNILSKIISYFKQKGRVIRLKYLFKEYEREIKGKPDFSIETLRRYLIHQCGASFGRIKTKNSRINDID